MSRETVLIVEDEAIIVAQLQDTLNALGYTALEPVATGEAAIAAVQAQPPDLVLLDIKLAGEMDGITAAGSIQSAADIPIVYLTGYAQDSLLQRAKVTAPYGYLVKPVGERELAATLEMALYKHALDRRLRESEGKYRLLVDNAGEAIVVAQDGRLKFVNRMTGDLTGYSAQELTSRLFLEFIHPDDRGMVAERHLRQLESDVSLPRYEFRLITRDGSVRWVAIGAVLIDWEGRPATLDFISDITERKRAEEALRESEERYQLANRAMFDALWDWHLQTNDLWWNQNFRTHFGYSAEEIEPGIESWTSRIHPEELERVEVGIHAAIDSGQQSWSDQYRFRRKDGTYAEVDDRGYISREASGKPVRMIGVMQDITERKQAEVRAFELALERERTALLTKFIQDASHEFRTPLTVMQLNLYLLERLEDPAKRPDMLAQIREQVTGIARLVDLLTERAWLDSDVPFTLRPADLNGLIAAAAGELQGAAAAKDLTLHLALAPDLPPVLADGNQLDMALHELLDNAMRYTPFGGSVTVRSAGDADGVTVEVQDTGPGIPPDALPHIFERFYRQDVAHTTSGFRLGLPIARAIVNRHGGRLDVESQPGAGSVFRIRLPWPGTAETGL